MHIHYTEYYKQWKWITATHNDVAKSHKCDLSFKKLEKNIYCMVSFLLSFTNFSCFFLKSKTCVVTYT